MASMLKKSNSVLSDLKSLVEELTDRDAKLKRDFRLFEDFFEHFPIPVGMSSASCDGKIITTKDKCFFCEKPALVEDLFECLDITDQIKSAHEAALKGESTKALIENDDYCFYVAIVARRDETDSVIGVSGIVWDVSSNRFILDTLMKIKNVTEDNSGSLEDIGKLASTAISKSRLMKLIDQDKKNVK